MAETFEELGLRPGLVDATEAADYPRPTELQAAAIPVLRRGGNAVLVASAGAGVVAAYGLALLDRLAEEAAPEPVVVRGLVLVGTPEEASAVAESINGMALPIGLRAVALAPGWNRLGVHSDILVATPRSALEAVRASELKLGGVAGFILDAGDSLLRDFPDEVETITSGLPGEAQRVVVAGDLEPARDYVERHVRRALQMPRSSHGEGSGAAAGGPLLGYAVRRARSRLDLLAGVLAEHEGPPPLVYCRTDERASELADGLASRGFAVGAAGDEQSDVAIAAASADPAVPDEGVLAISYDVPADPQTLLLRHSGGGLVLVESREVSHLQRIAKRAGATLQPRAEPLSALVDEDIESHRERLRRAIAEEDLAAQMLMLEPLFRSHTPAEVAAAASALLRQRAAPPAAVTGGASAAGSGAMAARPAAPSGAPAPPGWTRLFISTGRRDRVGPGDLVGAITGEAGLKGEEVGRIDIGDTFSIVEVAPDAADRVIRALNGTTVKGRSVRVDYDRERSGRSPRRSR